MFRLLPFVWLSVIGSVAAQPAPFETLSVGLALVEPLNRTALEEGWRTGTGAEVFAETPFYAGVVRLGAQWLPYHRRRFDLPELRAGFVFTDWRIPFTLPGHFRLIAGGRVGAFITRFGEADLAPNATVEQELAAYAVAGLERTLFRSWTLRACAMYGAVLWSEPLHPAYLTLGLRYTFATPRRLREALR